MDEKRKRGGKIMKKEGCSGRGWKSKQHYTEKREAKA